MRRSIVIGTSSLGFALVAAGCARDGALLPSAAPGGCVPAPAIAPFAAAPSTPTPAATVALSDISILVVGHRKNSGVSAVPRWFAEWEPFRAVHFPTPIDYPVKPNAPVEIRYAESDPRGRAAAELVLAYVTGKFGKPPQHNLYGDITKRSPSVKAVAELDPQFARDQVEGRVRLVLAIGQVPDYPSR